ncbi:MAG: single-stranded-DNA-specific exonuclease RecJ, partial [Candidatus Limnocylindria bacterium]
SLDRLLGSGGHQFHPIEQMADAAHALERLETALRRRERIALWGDYDADGMTAVSIWLLALRALGGDPVRHVPSRLGDGYGLSAGGLRALRDAGVSVVVTSDCGVTNVDEVESAARIGVDIVITDHHLPGPRLPAAVAVVDPHRADCRYPEKQLTGAGVAFKLATALLATRGVEVEGLAALAAIGTVADMAPLLGENRAIVRVGLAELASTERAGLRALVARAANLPGRPTARDLAFGVAPRLNAAGRIAEAELAIRLLIAEERDAAEALADQLDALNRERQALTRSAVEEALALCAAGAGDGPLIVRRDDWPPGIVGLVAGRLVDLLGRPVAAVSAVGDELRGSVRAPAGFHVANALTACAEHLTKLGGHPGAGGFSLPVERFAAFSSAFESLPGVFPLPLRAASGGPTRPASSPDARSAFDVDLVLPANLVGWQLAAEIERLEPFGVGWPEPVLAITGLVVGDVRRAGAEDSHLVLRMLRGYESIDAVAFDTPVQRTLPEVGMRLDIVATIDAGRWMGEPRLRLRVRDYAEAPESPIAARRAVAPVAATA